MSNNYKEHLSYIQNFWSDILNKGDSVIDATVGNGYDCLYLSKKVLAENEGCVFGYDLQKTAIENTLKRLSESLSPKCLERVKLFNKSHESFEDIESHVIKLITYNLGYLPGSDKTIQTKAQTTLTSIKNAIALNPRHISIVSYSGHVEGAVEEREILYFLEKIPKNQWTVSWKRWINRKFFPSVFLLKNRVD